jgi:uncharacterized protein (TIGR03066 family)
MVRLCNFKLSGAAVAELCSVTSSGGSVMRVVLLLVACVACGDLFAGIAAAEDLKTSVVGKWESAGDTANPSKIPLEFCADGTAKVGVVKENGVWVIAEGKYTVSKEGRVDFEGKFGESGTLGQHWTLKDGVLVGPRGPNPMVNWVKVKEDKEKK